MEQIKKAVDILRFRDCKQAQEKCEQCFDRWNGCINYQPNVIETCQYYLNFVIQEALNELQKNNENIFKQTY